MFRWRKRRQAGKAFFRGDPEPLFKQVWNDYLDGKHSLLPPEAIEECQRIEAKLRADGITPHRLP